MNYRYSIVSFLLVIMVLFLAACGGNGDTNSNNNNTSNNEGIENKGNESEASADKITIFQSKVEISEQLEALGDEYTAETGVEVEVWGTTGDGYFQQLQVQLNGEQGPSILDLGSIIEAERLSSYL